MWFDPSVVEAVRDAVPPWLGVLMVVLSYLGSIYLIAPSVIAAYWYRRDVAAPWLGGIVGCYGLMSVLKTAHTSARPSVGPPVGADQFPGWFVPGYEHAAHIGTTSFPSGHAMAVTIVAGMIAVDVGGDRWNRVAASVALIGWVGFTRIGLGVHYPGDVVGGIAYGLGFLGLFYLARRSIDDEARAAFGVAIAFGLAALVVSGSRNAHVAFGCGIGGLLAWQYAPLVGDRLRDPRRSFLLPILGASLPVATWFVLQLERGGHAVVGGWAGFLFAAVVLVPWLGPLREPRALIADRLLRRKSG